MKQSWKVGAERALSAIILASKFAVAKKGPDVQLIKVLAGKPVTIFLKEVEEGYWMEPPKHEYRCTYSHFDFNEEEQRFTRRKDLLVRLIPHLKKTGLWEYIVNKDGFFKVNPNNKKMTAKKLGALQLQYKSLFENPGK